jgi:hypothetical protein
MARFFEYFTGDFDLRPQAWTTNYCNFDFEVLAEPNYLTHCVTTTCSGTLLKMGGGTGGRANGVSSRQAPSRRATSRRAAKPPSRQAAKPPNRRPAAAEPPSAAKPPSAEPSVPLYLPYYPSTCLPIYIVLIYLSAYIPICRYSPVPFCLCPTNSEA